MRQLKLKTCTIAAVAFLLSACSSHYIAPTPVQSSQPTWSDVPQVQIAANVDGATEYRIARSAKTEYGTPYKLENWLERTAVKFCAHQSKHYRLLSERKAFHNAEHNARVELIFCCTEDPSLSSVQPNPKIIKKNERLAQNRYRLLTQLKQLYDDGVISKDEYEREKAKYLGQ